MSVDYVYYDGEEKDPRLQVELWEPSPYLPDTLAIFEGLHFDERGLVLEYSDSSGRHPKNYDMKIVFSGGFQGVRMSSVSALEEAALGFFAQKTGVEDPKFWAFRCKYTNYFNWCVEKRFNDAQLERNGYHYVLWGLDTLVEVFSDKPPRVFFDGYGMGSTEDSCEPYPVCNILYNYHSTED